MSSRAIASSASASSSSSSSPADQNDAIDLLEVFGSSPPPSKTSQRITLSSVPYDVRFSLNASRQSELLFEPADQIKLKPTPEPWKFGGSADVAASTDCCCFSADSKYFITGGRDCKIRLWNPSTRTLVATLADHASFVNSLISFSLNGNIMLASGSWDGTIHIWEWTDYAASAFSSPFCVATSKAGSVVNALSYCPKQNVLISGQRDKTIKLWSASNWQCIQTLSSFASSPLCALSLSCDASKLASGHEDGSIHIWSMSTRTEIKRWNTAKNHITLNGLCFSPCHPDILVAASVDGTCTSWHCATGSKIGSILSQSHSYCSPAAFSPNDGNYFVTVSSARQLIVVDSKTNNVIRTMDGCPPVKHISSACFSPDGKYLACGTTYDSTSFYMWESPMMISAAPFSAAARSVLPEPASDFRLVALSDSTRLAVVRLSSGKWAISTVASMPSPSATGLTVTKWTLVPSSMPHPIIRFLPIDGITLKIEDKNQSSHLRTTSVPIFIGKNANLLSESYTSAAQLATSIVAEKKEMHRQVTLVKEEAARANREAAASIEAKERDLAKQVALAEEVVVRAKQEAAVATARAREEVEASKREVAASAAALKIEAAAASALVKAEAAKLQSYLIKQETGMDEALLELSFGNLSDPSYVDRCRSILESHMSSSMAELRSIYSVFSSSPSASVPKGISTPFASHPSSKNGHEEEKPASDAIDWKSLSIQRELGDGGFGSVFACELTFDDGTTRPVAMKVPARTARVTLSSSSSVSSPQAPAASSSSAEVHASSKCIQNEIATFRRIEHPNVVRYIGFTVEPLDSRQVCNDEKIAFQLAMQIASGMSAVHSLGVAHRDLKPANVLLCPLAELSMTVAKITDCGSANLKDLNAEQSRMTGVTSINGLTSRYCAPELLDDDLLEEWESSYAQDLWAFGLLLFQLRTGKAPFEKCSERTVIGHILTGKPPGVWPQENEQQWDWLRTLASQCLEVQPSDRLAHFEALGASADGRRAFSAIEKKLCEARPEWAKEVKANMLKFQRMEIRDPFLKNQIDSKP